MCIRISSYVWRFIMEEIVVDLFIKALVVLSIGTLALRLIADGFFGGKL